MDIHVYNTDTFVLPFLKVRGIPLEQCDEVAIQHQRLGKFNEQILTLLQQVDDASTKGITENIQPLFFEELQKIFIEYRNFIIPHLQLEEDLCQVDFVNSTLHDAHFEIYKELTGEVTSFTRDRGLLTVMFWYSLTARERDIMGGDLSWPLRCVLIPLVWTKKWRSLLIFFPYPPTK
jgi:hypothetical protein